MEYIVDISIRRRGLLDGFRVAIVGKPNVGKSSLLNSLLQYDRAIVSEIAGTTRDTIEEKIQIGSHVICLIDTAGIRENAGDKIEEIGIGRSIESIESADIVIALFDSSREIDESDNKILELLSQYPDKETIVAVSKTDLDTKIDKSFIEKKKPIEINRDDNYALLVDELGRRLDNIQGDDEIMLISSRQIGAVKMCAKELQDAMLPLEREELEFFSYHIQEAIGHISTITRAYSSEEILDKMFGEFCLGK